MSEGMPRATTESHRHRRPGSSRNWATIFIPKSKVHRYPDTPQISPTAPRTSGSDEETPSASSSDNSGSDFTGAFNARSDGPPSYAHAVSRSEPTSYRFVQESAFSMNLVMQEDPSATAYNISVGVNVWMPSEHITLVRRHADPEGPVLARLE